MGSFLHISNQYFLRAIFTYTLCYSQELKNHWLTLQLATSGLWDERFATGGMKSFLSCLPELSTDFTSGINQSVPMLLILEWAFVKETCFIVWGVGTFVYEPTIQVELWLLDDNNIAGKVYAPQCKKSFKLQRTSTSKSVSQADSVCSCLLAHSSMLQPRGPNKTSRSLSQ